MADWARARYDVGFLGDAIICCEACGTKRLETGNVREEGLTFLTIEHPRPTGELCDDCLEWIVEPFCCECADNHRQLMPYLDESMICPDCVQGRCPDCGKTFEAAGALTEHLTATHDYYRHSAAELVSERLFPEPPITELLDAELFEDELATLDF